MEKSEEGMQIQNRSLRLDHEWVQVLINLRMKYAKSFSGKRHSATSAWDNILKEMYDLGAPKSITRLRIKKKWMNLIAKYKQLKCDAGLSKQNAWPYFEQIDRAYSKKSAESNANFIQRSISSPMDDEPKEPSEKEKFVRTLINLRYQYSNLFTGKKYAAQKGWMTIQNYLPSGEKYSINQISKVWHNLIQNYKNLIEKEPDHSNITWVYFQQLHQIMSMKKDSGEGTNTIEFVDQYFPTVNGSNEEFADNCQNPLENITDEKAEVVPFLTEDDDTDEDKNTTGDWEMETGEPTRNINNDNLTGNEQTTSLNDILNYMKESDRKRDEQMKQMLSVMQDILCHLKQ